jgi:class 3 adenylate cyclase
LTFALVQEPIHSKSKLEENGSSEQAIYMAEENAHSVEILKYTVRDEYGQLGQFPGTVVINVLRHGPTVMALEAVPHEEGYQRGSIIRIVFSEPTNMPLINEKTDAVVEFQPPIARRFALEWESERVLLVVVLEPFDSSEGLIGTSLARVHGEIITAKDGLSVAVNAESLTLEGSWQSPPSSSSNSMTAWNLATAIVLPAILVLVSAVLCLIRSKRRNLKAAPKDTNVPLSIIFTDIENSTKLWSRNPEAMSKALDVHHRVIRKAIRANYGYEVKTIGDAFMIACKNATDAMQLALEIQIRMNHAFQNDLGKTIADMYKESNDKRNGTNNKKDEQLIQQSDFGLKVRIGLHHGIADITLDEVTKGYDYYGPTVNLASRVESAGHGGQILITSEAFKQVKFDLHQDMVIKDLGVKALRGVGNVELYEVSPVEFSERKFGPLRLDKIVTIPDPTEPSPSQEFTLGMLQDVEAHSPQIIPAATTSFGLTTAWVFSMVQRQVMVQSGSLTAGELHEFVLPIVEAIILLFSVGGEQSKQTVRGLCARWKVDSGGLH